MFIRMMLEISFNYLDPNYIPFNSHLHGEAMNLASNNEGNMQ